ncbi:hypothetical protein CKM354_000250700 [Cercospora kikuchii]|uniref:Uncharacterized protein n=1 Tax=Cercospora kikuchii TaxID=84275 RepID=A0A9P3CAE1_9PEZI|nr:uncharacterized protein CKM354_000250700 [Cercospora kikuchii]GIZ39116.1 hypothetical protein CKM354_000250700 [Cercospora kikuchii]
MNLLARIQAWWQGEPHQIASVAPRSEAAERPALRHVREGTQTAVVHDRVAFVDLLARSAELRFTRRRLLEAIERYESEILPLQANMQADNDYLDNINEYRAPETEPMIAEYERDAAETREYLYGQFGYLERIEQARKRLTATEAASSDVWKKIHASTRYWVAHSEPRCFAGLDCDDELQFSFVNISSGAARLESSRKLVRQTAESAAQACQALIAARRDARKQDQAFAPSEDAEARVKLANQNEKKARTEYNLAREALTLAQAVQIQRESNFVDTDLLDALIDNGVWKDVHSPRMSELSNLDMISQHEPEMRTPSPFVPHPIIQDLEYTREQVALADGNINELKLNCQRGLVNYLVLYGLEGRERWNESFRQDYEGMSFEAILEEEEQMRAEAQENYTQCKAEAKRLDIQDQPFTPPGYAPVPAHIACYPPEDTGWIESVQQRQRPKVMKWAAGVARGSPASFRDRTSVDLLGSPRRADSWPIQQGSSPTSSRAGLVQRAKNARIAKTKQSTRERNRASRRIWQERLRKTMKQHGRAAKFVGEENSKIDWNSFYPDLDAPPQQEVPVQQVSAHQDAQEQSAEESNSGESYNSNSTTGMFVQMYGRLP